MHCYNCEKTIEVTGGMMKIPVFLFTRNVYHHSEAIVIECPHCQQLIAIQDFVEIELTEQIKVDTSVQTV